VTAGFSGGLVGGSPLQEFAIRNVLCAVDFGPRSHQTVLWAAQIAAEFAARLTLAKVNASVQIWGPAAATSIQTGKRR
jgi:hypothetical protein